MVFAFGLEVSVVQEEVLEETYEVAVDRVVCILRKIIEGLN